MSPSSRQQIGSGPEVETGSRKMSPVARSSSLPVKISRVVLSGQGWFPAGSTGQFFCIDVPTNQPTRLAGWIKAQDKLNSGPKPGTPCSTSRVLHVKIEVSH